MQIKGISLYNYRNYSKTSFEFSDGVTVVYGPNGAGKTNILEAVSFISTGKSFRAIIERELIKISADFAKIKGDLSNGDSLESIIALKPNSNRVQKSFKQNSVIRPATRFIGILKTIMFSPEDIRLVAGSPSRRREYLNKFLSQISPDYHKNLIKYEKILKQRNKLLESYKSFFSKDVFNAQYDLWTGQLAECGIYIQNERRKFFSYATAYMPEISRDIYPRGNVLKLKYFANSISIEKLNSLKGKEILKGTTQAGPHRDDYGFFFTDEIAEEDLDLRSYGSRGQQRTSVLGLKLLELKYMKEVSKENPIILLDDIFSELDEDYRKAVENIIKNQQTIITTADINNVPENIKSQAKLIYLGS
jgi:DNA replication and repair protein RecF